LKLDCSNLDIPAKNASCYDGVLSAWFHFSGNANFATQLYHARRFGDRFFALNVCKKDQDNTANL